MIVKLGSKAASCGRRRPAEQVAREDAGPGRLGVDPQRPAMGGGGADEAVLAVQVAAGEVAGQPRPQSIVVGLRDRPVDRTPPDLVVAARLVDDELVLRRATGVLAGPDDERAIGRDEALPVADRVLVQLGGRQVGTNGTTQDGARESGAVLAIGGGLLMRRRSRSDRPAARDAGPKARRSRLPQSCVGACYHVAEWLRSVGSTATSGYHLLMGVHSMLLIRPSVGARRSGDRGAG